MAYQKQKSISGPRVRNPDGTFRNSIILTAGSEKSMTRLLKEFDIALADDDAVDLLHAGDNQCRWIYGQSTCCGKRVYKKGLCEKHYNIAWGRK